MAPDIDIHLASRMCLVGSQRENGKSVLETKGQLVAGNK